MKIITEDQNQLVATDKAIGALVMGVVFVLVGIAIAVTSLGSHSMPGTLIGLAFAAVGALIVVFHKTRTLTVDKASSQITVTLKGLVGSGQRSYPLGEVVKMQLVTSYQTVSTGGPRTSGISIGGAGNTETEQKTRLLLVLKDGTTIDLADGQRSMQSFGIFGSVPNQAAGQRIAAYLGVPFESVGDQSLGQVIGAVENAIKGQAQAPSVVPTSQPPAAPVPNAAEPQPAPDSDSALPKPKN